MNKNYLISGFSDEIDAGIIKQFDVISKLGIKYFEPRVIDGKNVSNLNKYETATLKKIMGCYGITVSSIGSPIGKIKTTDDFDAHFDLFKNTVEVANTLGAKYIRAFSFFMPENEKPEDYTGFVVEKLGKMVEYAAQNGVVLLHENEKGIYGNIAVRCKTLFEQIKSDNFRAVFDFSNFVECSQDTLEAYDMLKPYIEYIHIKDCIKNGHVVPVGFGDGNVEAILKDLYKNGYDGFLSLEPHLSNYEVPSDAGKPVSEFTEVNSRRFACAYKALCDILARI